MQLSDKTYTRLELEETIRVQYPSQDLLARYAVNELKLDPALFSIVTYAVLIHWVLDMLTDQSKKSGAPKIASIVKMGLTPPRKSQKVKIMGYTSPNDEVFMQSFLPKLASMINSKNACMPNEYEGLDIDVLKRYINGEITEQKSEEVIVDKKKKTTAKDAELDKRIAELAAEVARLRAQVEAHHEILTNQ